MSVDKQSGLQRRFEYISSISGGAIEDLEILRGAFNIDPSLSDDEALQEYIKIHTAPPPEPEATPEERIAAELEFQNLLRTASNHI